MSDICFDGPEEQRRIPRLLRTEYTLDCFNLYAVPSNSAGSVCLFTRVSKRYIIYRSPLMGVES